MTDAPQKAHILAINNSQDVLDLFRELLEEEDYRVSTQAYASRDLDEIRQLAPDLIILDYMWGSEDAGWSLLQMLRMDRQTARIPIVLCTGAVREVDALSGHLAEMGVSVVLKPFDIDRLIEVIAAALRVAHERDGQTDGRTDGRTGRRAGGRTGRRAGGKATSSSTPSS